MKYLYPSVHELANNTDTDFLNTARLDWVFGFGHIPLYVEFSVTWEKLYYNGFISESEYANNPFPL